MKQTTDELKKIIENAPEGASGFSCVGDKIYYTKILNSQLYEFSQSHNCWWVFGDFDDVDSLNSLSDIKEIVELRERLENAAMYLDSFIDTEQDSNMLPCYDCGCVGSCEVDFTEAYKALGMLKGRN